MKKNFFKNMNVEEIIKAIESKFFSILKRYDLGNLNIALTYIKKPDIFYEKQVYMEIPQKLYLQALSNYFRLIISFMC